MHRGSQRKLATGGRDVASGMELGLLLALRVCRRASAAQSERDAKRVCFLEDMSIDSEQ